jgi:DNA-binding CsgD family transcriptional regulator
VTLGSLILLGGSVGDADIGAMPFISTHAVAYHPRKIYVKLGVASRTQLTSALPESEPVPG